MKEQRKHMLDRSILKHAIKDSFIKLNPMIMMKNPVMFVVEIGTLVVLLMLLFPGYFGTGKEMGFNLAVFVILLFTLLFANFAEALAEGRGKAQAASLKNPSRIRKLTNSSEMTFRWLAQPNCVRGTWLLSPRAK